MFKSEPDVAQPVRRDSGVPLWKDGVMLEKPTRIFIALNFMDLFMTFFLLSRGGFHESNQLADYFLSRWGINGMVWFKIAWIMLVVVIAQVVARRRLGAARFVLYFGCMVVGGVVLYSAWLFLKYGGPVVG